MAGSGLLVNLNSKVLSKGAALPAVLQNGQLRLYGMRFCPFVQRVLIYLVAKGVPAEIVNIKPRDVPEWYPTKHYKGQIPALEEGGRAETVVESAAICEYLDDRFDQHRRVLPSDPYEKVQQKLLFERLNHFSATFFAIISLTKSDEGKAEKYASLEKAFAEIETLLPETLFFTGSRCPGFVDYMIYPNIQRVFWLSHIFPDFPLPTASFPGGKYPKVSEWYSRVQNLPEVIAAGPADADGVTFFDAYIRGSTEHFDVGL